MTIKEIEALPKDAFLTFNYKDENIAIMRKTGIRYKTPSEEYQLGYVGLWVRTPKAPYGPDPQLVFPKYYTIGVTFGTAKNYSVDPNAFSRNKSQMVKTLFLTGKLL